MSLITVMLLAKSSDIRSTFHSNMRSESGLNKLIENKDYPSTAITKAYKGLAETMLAEYAFLPTTKLSHFNAGKKKIEAAVKSSPNSAEVRYTRLMVQLNAPSMLGYDDNIDDDIKIFTQKLKVEVKDKSWQIKFVKNLLAAKYIEDKHTKKLKTLL